MKSILFLILFSFGSLASACDVPSEKFLRGMLHEGSVPTRWQTVKGKTYERNRSVDALGVIGRTQERSYAIYKGERYTAEDVVFCKTGSNTLKATHPDHGTVNLTRTGKGRNSMLSARWGIFKYNLRLSKYVK